MTPVALFALSVTKNVYVHSAEIACPLVYATPFSVAVEIPILS